MHARSTPGGTQRGWFLLPRALPQTGLLFRALRWVVTETSALGHRPRRCRSWKMAEAERRKLLRNLQKCFQNRSLILLFLPPCFFEKAYVIPIHARDHVWSTESSQGTRVNGLSAWHMQNAPRHRTRPCPFTGASAHADRTWDDFGAGQICPDGMRKVSA